MHGKKGDEERVEGVNSPVNLPNLVSFQLVVKALLVTYTTSITFTTSTHISKCLFLVPFTGFAEVLFLLLQEC